MLSGFLLSIHSLRAIVPVVTLLGSAPTFFALWFLLRSITLIGFPRHIYRRCDDILYSMYQRCVLFFFENWANVKIYLHGDYEEILKKPENVLYICNHQSAVDWVVANMLAVRQGSLGHIRYVLKDDLKWIPLYGFYFQQHGCIYVRRNDKGDIQRVQTGMRKLERDGFPVWLVIFPEGTRYNPVTSKDAIERARLFAQEKGVKPFDHLLYPRSGATVAALTVLKDKFDAVYDITVMYSQTYDNNRQVRLAAPSMTEYMQGRTNSLHLHIRRIPMSEIPTESHEQISKWLYERFVVKDQLLGRFYDWHRTQSNIHTDEIVQLEDNPRRQAIRVQLPLQQTLFSCIFFSLTTLPFLISQSGHSFYWKICLIGTPLSLLWLHLFPPSHAHI